MHLMSVISTISCLSIKYVLESINIYIFNAIKNWILIITIIVIYNAKAACFFY